MNVRRILATGAVAGALGLGLMRLNATATAQSAPSAISDLKIAVANPAHIFTELQETKDVKAKMDTDTKQLAAEQDQKRKDVEEMQQALQLLKPGTQEYQDHEKALMQKSIEYDVWVQVTTKELQQQQKTDMKQLFDKIEAAIGDIAKQEGIDLVIADQGTELPDDLDQLTVDQVRGLISQRTILYSDGKNNLDNDVILDLDKQYQNHQ